MIGKARISFWSCARTMIGFSRVTRVSRSRSQKARISFWSCARTMVGFSRVTRVSRSRSQKARISFWSCARTMVGFSRVTRVSRSRSQDDGVQSRVLEVCQDTDGYLELTHPCLEVVEVDVSDITDGHREDEESVFYLNVAEVDLG